MLNKVLFLFGISVLSGLTMCRTFPNPSVYSSRLPRFEAALATLSHTYHLPGLAVAIASSDSLIYAGGFGFADREQQIPVTENTPFRIASLTKPVSAAVLMHLVEEQKIDLNWKIKAYYPDYEEKCRRILGYFREEMPEYTFLLENYHTERDDILIKHHLSHTAENKPGDAYSYNGFLYGMLSPVMETATGQSFESLVDHLVIDPLHMDHSASSQLDSSKMDVLNALAKPYIFQEDSSYLSGEYPNMKLNAGAGMISSAADLLLFDRAINRHTLVSAETQTLQFTPFTLNDGSLSPYGYGWFTQKYKGYTLVWHYGWQPDAYSGLYLKVLEKNLTLVLLANSDGLSKSFDLGKGAVETSDFARSFLDIFLE